MSPAHLRARSRVIAGDTPGTATTLHWYEAGPEDAATKVHLQAALHADEQPGTMVLHHLLRRLDAAGAEGRLRARFAVFPSVNPLGLASFSLRTHLGRYDVDTGVNHNRRWPDLFAAIGPSVLEALGADPVRNLGAVRAALARWIAARRPGSAAERLRLAILESAHDADIVLDLHCDSDSLKHIFISPDMMPACQDLADWMGAAATLTAEDSGGGSFDEMLPALYRAVARAAPDRPVPMGCIAATLEYRGRADIEDALGAEDAAGLFGFLAMRGLIDADPGPRPPPAPPATAFEATEVLRAEAPGLLAYRVGLGASVGPGEVVADLIGMDGPDAFLARTPLRAGTAGLVLSRALTKYVPRGAVVAKIVGTTPLAGRVGGYLLED